MAAGLKSRTDTESHLQPKEPGSGESGVRLAADGLGAITAARQALPATPAEEPEEFDFLAPQRRWRRVAAALAAAGALGLFGLLALGGGDEEGDRAVKSAPAASKSAAAPVEQLPKAEAEAPAADKAPAADEAPPQQKAIKPVARRASTKAKAKRVGSAGARSLVRKLDF